MENTSNQSSKFRTKTWIEINDDIRVAYSPNKQIRLKTAMLRSTLCDYSDAYIFVKGNITANNTQVQVMLQIIPVKKQYLKVVLHLLTV